MPEISIIIPVYNSSDCLEELFNRINNAFDDIIPYEVLLVNDASSDSSKEIILNYCKSHLNFKLIDLKENSGQNAALLTGLLYCDGNYVIIMDDDLQHNPKDAIHLFIECKKGYDVCYARFLSKKQPYWKRLGSIVNGTISTLAGKKSKSLYLSPFKAISGNFARTLPYSSHKTYYLDALILESTKSITQIDIPHYARYAGRGNFDFLTSAKLFSEHFKSLFINQVKFLIVTGLLSILLGTILGIFAFWKGDSITGLYALICFLGGSTLYSLASIIKRFEVSKKEFTLSNLKSNIKQTVNLTINIQHHEPTH